MNFLRTIKSYVWWTHARGSLHYDVMVSLILLFIFVAPRYLDFRDAPTHRDPPTSEIRVSSDRDGLIYEVNAAVVADKKGDELPQALRRSIEPVSGEVHIVRIEPVIDRRGRVISYKVWATR